MSNEKTIIRKTINLLQTNETVDDPSLSLLLANGWKVFCSVPIEQEGKPTLVIYLNKKIENNENNEVVVKKSYLDYANFLFIFVFCLYILITNII
jgi:hypothetical protein